MATPRRNRQAPAQAEANRPQSLDDDRPEILMRRLIEGERQIALAEARGDDTSRLVDFWIELLRQYERMIDAVPAAA